MGVYDVHLSGKAMKILDELLLRKPELRVCSYGITAACKTLINSFNNGNKLLICGNGGSSADAEHISGELLKGFRSKRLISEQMKKALTFLGKEGLEVSEKLQEGLPVIPIHLFTAGISAFSNDVDPALAYAQMVYALGNRGDVLLSISTSGNADNVYFAALTAKAAGIYNIGLTGSDGGRLKTICNLCIRAPEDKTYLVQEQHLSIYHTLCAMIEAHIYG